MSAPKEQVVDALAQVWTSLMQLGEGLSETHWATPTALPGWTVKDLYAHMAGTEMSLAGHPAPAVQTDVRALSHVGNDIAALNELWVEAHRSLSGAEVLARFQEITNQRRQELERMSQTDFDADSWTPAGPASYGRFMQIRVYDCWVHEQDARDALGQEGDELGVAAGQAVDEVIRALGYVVGKKAGATQGQAVTFELTAPVPRLVHVLVEGRAAVVEELPRAADVIIRMPSSLFVRMGAGRPPPERLRGRVEMEGEADLGQRVVDNLNFTI
jgi:uncharacterized protein (TIGR03083 family)